MAGTKISKLKKVATIFCLLATAACFCALYFFHSAVQIVSAVSSPDGSNNAMVLVINPGSADGFYTAVAIEPGNNIIWRQIAIFSAKDFVIDDNNGAITEKPDGRLNVGLKWMDARTLAVQFPAKAEIIRQERAHGNVAIKYIPI